MAVETYEKDVRIDDYIGRLPDWQREICSQIRELLHRADAEIVETIKFTNRPYFVLRGNVCALQATCDHVNVFIYDPIVPDPEGIINQGQRNSTARNMQIFKGQVVNADAFVKIIRAVVENNRAGGWRKLRP